MTKTKSTKRALLMSALSLLMCVSMLIGSTFAWFTDSVTSSGNIIKSGTLDVTMEWKDATANGAQKTYKDASTGPIFNYDLWEPGYVEAKNIKISNVGTLALKYNLNIAANGEVSELADVIDVYFAEGEHTLANRDMTDLTRVGTLRDILNGMPANMVGDLEAKTADTVTIALKMQEDAGNKYQGLSIGSDFSVQLLATQLTSESDSFDNQYDKGAAWDGVVPDTMPETLVVDGTTQTVHVKDAAAFAYLSTLSAEWAKLYTNGEGTDYGNYMVENGGKGSEYYYSGKWTVSLDADINLFNYPIEPVNIVFGASTGATAFNGNGHVISNINTTTGLFANNTRASFSDLTLENVRATNGALIGSANASISDVTVKNANISGVDYVGGLVGYIYGDVTGCKVIDSSIAASGKEAGGLIGYVASSSGAGKVTANEVRNVSVYADNRAAGLVAQANVGVKVYNNTIDTVTVLATGISSYQPGAVVSNALAPENVYENPVTNVSVTQGVAISSADDLLTAVENKQTAIITADTVITLDEAVELENPVVGKAVVVNYGTLNITGGDYANGDTTNSGSAVIENRGVLNISGGEFGTDGNSGRAVSNIGGTVTITGGTFSAFDRNEHTSLAAYVFATNGGKITIENGTSIGAPNGIFYASNGGEIIVNGGTFTKGKAANNYYLAYANGGTIKLNGGTYVFENSDECIWPFYDSIDGLKYNTTTQIYLDESCNVNWDKNK